MSKSQTAIKEPRQFWLMLAPFHEDTHGKDTQECLAYTYEPEHSALKHLATHVIEYGAYEQAVKERDEITAFIKNTDVYAENERLKSAIRETSERLLVCQDDEYVREHAEFLRLIIKNDISR